MKTLKRLIAKLYFKYSHQKVESAFIDNVQRDFSKQLNEAEERERDLACKSFEKWIEPIFNVLLRDYVSALFNEALTHEMRDDAVKAINVLLAAERAFKGYAVKIDEPKVDKFSII